MLLLCALLHHIFRVFHTKSLNSLYVKWKKKCKEKLARLANCYFENAGNSSLSQLKWFHLLLLQPLFYIAWMPLRLCWGFFFLVALRLLTKNVQLWNIVAKPRHKTVIERWTQPKYNKDRKRTTGNHEHTQFYREKNAKNVSNNSSILYSCMFLFIIITLCYKLL